MDYEETFAPVAKMTTVRTLIAVSSIRQWKIYQMDVKNAFLNGDLHEEVYMSPPLVLPTDQVKFVDFGRLYMASNKPLVLGLRNFLR